MKNNISTMIYDALQTYKCLAVQAGLTLAEGLMYDKNIFSWRRFFCISRSKLLVAKW